MSPRRYFFNEERGILILFLSAECPFEDGGVETKIPFVNIGVSATFLFSDDQIIAKLRQCFEHYFIPTLESGLFHGLTSILSASSFFKKEPILNLLFVVRAILPATSPGFLLYHLPDEYG